MNPGYNADNWKIIQDNAKLLGIPLTVFERYFRHGGDDRTESVLPLCQNATRSPYAQAKALGCNKI